MFGIDVSEYQRKVDWTKLRVDFVQIKATEGLTYADPTLNINRTGAQAAKLPYGFYHFGRPDHHPGISGAQAEAAFFCKTIGSTWPLRPTLDLEEGSGDLTTWAGAFLSEVERLTGTRPILYSFRAFFLSHLNLKALAGYNLWVADYGVNDGK